ncbi:MAG: nicotinamide riboside transporter PnuC [Bacteroidales bacterium]|nr:nicotinamide riboside transporter PnuC [Bacteroidales bacterium]
MNWAEIISSVLGLTCVVLAGRNSKNNFWVGYLYNLFLFLLFWKQKLFAAMVLQPVSLAINAYGHYRWTHPGEHERASDDPGRLKVSHLGPREWSGLLLIAMVFGSVLGGFLSGKTADPSPWLDAYILMLTFLAQYLSAIKCWECWIVWMVVNVANMVLYLQSGLVMMPVVSGIYLANGIWSLITWKKLNKNGQ